MYPAGHPTAAAGGVGGSDPSKANIQVPVLSPQEVPTPARSEVESISLASRVSEFWPDQPRVWFVRTEAILGPQKLSDEARFDLVVQKLGKDVVNHVTDILINPPPTKKFDTLKQRLLAIYEESHNRQIEKVISEFELGDQKPSQLLRRMREKAMNKFPDETLSVIWQNRLPKQVRAVLAVSAVTDLEDLAAVADKVMEATGSQHVSVVSQPQQPSTSFDVSLVMAEIAKINVKLSGMERSRRNDRPRNRSRYRNTFRNTSRSSSRNSPRRRPDNWLCFYHHRFRENAQKCSSPCAWKKPEN
ncbi:unnamed protein product [Plutella xylostella]|uniref:(diamondback moth) hypothetical protein n=1 Tax=Plutella xylostella TaxID=51655 RepID=A0A8S4DGR4_PLUXY|nr:uncharacterized protein LOC125490023 [Plutella xylostella]CAG9097741.1 unnamed protein product [Plutella xylostella]